MTWSSNTGNPSSGDGWCPGQRGHRLRVTPELWSGKKEGEEGKEGGGSAG